MGSVFTRQPQLLLLGMALQFTVLPTIAWAISKWCASAHARTHTHTDTGRHARAHIQQDCSTFCKLHVR